MRDDALQITRDDRQMLVVLRGSWSRETSHLDPATLLADIGSLSTLKIDASEVDDWDSTLVRPPSHCGHGLTPRPGASGGLAPRSQQVTGAGRCGPRCAPGRPARRNSRATLWSRLDPGSRVEPLAVR